MGVRSLASCLCVCRYIVAHPPWLFNNAGGAMGAMYVLHCSFTGACASDTWWCLHRNSMQSFLLTHLLDMTLTSTSTSSAEYVIIFGTAVGTEGHSGRFLADVRVA